MHEISLLHIDSIHPSVGGFPYANPFPFFMFLMVFVHGEPFLLGM